MAKYVKKPVVIEAYQTDKEMIIHTLEGDMKASVGDYIITGVNGEQYPCKPDIFKKTYEPVEKDGFVKMVTGKEAVGCAKKIKEYCAEFAYVNCRSCALCRDGCFVDHNFYINHDKKEPRVFYPLDWEV